MSLPEVDDEGFRRTAVKSRHRSMVTSRAGEHEDRGELTKIVETGGYHHLYVKKRIDDGKKIGDGKHIGD